MHTKLGSLFCVAGWALSFGGGCDDQVAPEYYRTSLLTVTGSCEIPNNQTRGDLSPVLAFDEGPALRLVDVPVHGSFPSNFSIAMYEPPPEATLHHPTDQEEGEPLVSIGYITAAPKDHPVKVYSGNSSSGTGFDCKDEGRSDNLCLYDIDETCPAPNTDNIPCYVEKRYCPKGERDSDKCIVEKSGDPTLKNVSIFTQFAGYSRNYQVIYLSEAAAPGSATAAWFEAEGGVPAGYGLYEVRALSDDSAEDCYHSRLAYELGARYYNEAHGTDYESLDCDVSGDLPYCTMFWDDLEGRTGAIGEISRLLEKANMELGCSISGAHYKRIDDPANTPISIVIVPNHP